MVTVGGQQVNTTGNASIALRDCHMGKADADHSQEFYVTAASTEFFE